jgi:hypothetical protein
VLLQDLTPLAQDLTPLARQDLNIPLEFSREISLILGVGMAAPL